MPPKRPPVDTTPLAQTSLSVGASNLYAPPSEWDADEKTLLAVLSAASTIIEQPNIPDVATWKPAGKEWERVGGNAFTWLEEDLKRQKDEMHMATTGPKGHQAWCETKRIVGSQWR